MTCLPVVIPLVPKILVVPISLVVVTCVLLEAQFASLQHRCHNQLGAHSFILFSKWLGLKWPSHDQVGVTKLVRDRVGQIRDRDRLRSSNLFKPATISCRLLWVRNWCFFHTFFEACDGHVSCDPFLGSAGVFLHLLRSRDRYVLWLTLRQQWRSRFFLHIRGNLRSIRCAVVSAPSPFHGDP